MVAIQIRRFVLSLVLGSLAVVAGVPVVHAQDAQPDAAAQAAAQAEAQKRAVTAVAEQFRATYAAGNAAGVWATLAPASRDQLGRDLAAIKETLKKLPANRQSETIDALNATPADVLSIETAEKFLEWLISRVDEGQKGAVGRLKLESVELAADGKSATLKWSATDEAGADAARAMPKTATLGADGTWGIAVASN